MFWGATVWARKIRIDSLIECHPLFEQVAANEEAISPAIRLNKFFN